MKVLQHSGRQLTRHYNSSHPRQADSRSERYEAKPQIYRNHLRHGWLGKLIPDAATVRLRLRTESAIRLHPSSTTTRGSCVNRVAMDDLDDELDLCYHLGVNTEVNIPR